MRSLAGGALAALGVLAVLCVSRAVGAQGADAQVGVALERMHHWLGTGTNGRRWRELLQSDCLAQQIQRGDGADPEVLAEILQQYELRTDGLDRPKFSAVRGALRRWLDGVDTAVAADLPALARRARDRFVPVTEGRLARSQARLASAAANLDRYLAPGGENGLAWRKYLKWDQLEAQLAGGAEPDLKVLTPLYRRLSDDHEGLELAVFADVAAALRQYIDLVAVAELPHPTEQYAKEMETLAVSLERYAQQPDAQDNFRIGQRLGWLHGSGQVPRLVRAARRVLSHPNLYARASARLLRAGTSRAVDRVDPVTDVILGTRIRGTAHTTGAVYLRPIPSDRGAALVSALAGTTASDTVGRNGPAVIYTDGLTNIRIEKRFVFDARGIRGLPASSRARTRTTTRAIAIQSGCFGRVLERIAWRRVGQLKPQAECIASRRAERRLNRRFDAEAQDQITAVQQRYADRFRNPLLRRRAFPQRFLVASSRDAVRLQVLQATRFQLGAPGAPPALPTTYDLALRTHESLVNNAAASLLAGRTFARQQVRQKAIELYGELPEELKADEDEEPWSVTFAVHQPVTILFADGQFRVTLRGSRFTSGQRRFKAMNVTAAYKMNRTESGAKLTRQGDLEILPPTFVPGKGRLSASQVALRRLLAKRLGRLFKPEIASHGLELPGDWKRVGKLRLAQLTASDGWLMLGWNMPPMQATATTRASTPK